MTRIHVAERDPALARVIELALCREGYQPQVHSSAKLIALDEAALIIADAHRGEPADLELIASLRHGGASAILALVWSGSVKIDRVLAAGADAVLEKPFEILDLLAVVHRVIGRE